MEGTPAVRGLLPLVAERSGLAWAGVDSLLRAGDYGELDRLLRALQTATLQSGDAAGAALLVAVDELCLTCDQLHQQRAEQLRMANQAGQLEDDTRRRVERLLRPLWREGDEVPELTGPPFPVVPPAPAEPSGRPSWLQSTRRRLENLFKPPTAEQAAPAGLGLMLPVASESLALDPLTVSPSPVAPESLFPVVPAVPAQPRPDAPREDLFVYCLGSFRVYYHDRLIRDWSGHKSRSLFKLLIIHRDQPTSIERLLDSFWRDSPPDSARRSLYQTIYLLRQTLRNGDSQASIIQVDGGYQLNPELTIWVDSEAFLRHYRRALEAVKRGDVDQAVEAFQAAEILYEGDFLLEDMYEEWPVTYREQLRNAYLDALDRLSRHYGEVGQDSLCVAYCRKLLELDNVREDIHRRLMRVFARQGQRTLALRQYHRCVEALREELDVEPLPGTTELYEKILKNGDHFRTGAELNGD